MFDRIFQFFPIQKIFKIPEKSDNLKSDPTEEFPDSAEQCFERQNNHSKYFGDKKSDPVQKCLSAGLGCRRKALRSALRGYPGTVVRIDMNFNILNQTLPEQAAEEKELPERLH